MSKVARAVMPDAAHVLRFTFHPCGPLAKIAKTVIAHQSEMEHTILSHLSNGKIEGTNNKIKLTKRMAFGYSDPLTFSCGCVWNWEVKIATTSYGDEPKLIINSIFMVSLSKETLWGWGMKNLLIAGVLVLSGSILTSAVLIAASIYTVTLDGWGGDSKIKSILFGGPYVQSENLMLGFSFVVGIILMCLGLLIVGVQWYLDWNQEADKKLAQMNSEAPQKI